MRDAPTPPALVAWVAARLLPSGDRELLLGDLEDVYAHRCAEGSAVTGSIAMLVEAAHAGVIRRRGLRRPPTNKPKGVAMLFDTVFQDLRVGVRGLFKQPGLTAAAMLTLALGIGANAAVFSAVNGVLLSPLPYREAENLLMIWNRWRNVDKTWVSDAEVVDYRTRTQAFQDVGAWAVGQVTVTGDGHPMRVGSGFITPNLLTVLGAEPALGRSFTAAEADVPPDQSTAVILSDELWRLRFGGRHDVIGSTLSVNGTTREVVGVMPPAFQLPTDYVEDAEEPTRIWLPLGLFPANRTSHSYYAVGRLKPGVSPAAASAELRALTGTLTSEGLYPEAMRFQAFGVPVTTEAYGGVRRPIFLLMGAVGCLLLIACANVANLLLVRADSRSREMAVRAALGAGRGRLVRQMFTESATLVAGAAAAGLFMAKAALELLRSADLTAIPRAGNITLDVRVVLFSLGLSLATLAIFSLAPALRASRVDLNESIKEGALSTTASGRRQRLRGLLVAAETALAVALLAGALLMIRTVWNLQQIELGFNPHGVLTMRLAVPPATYDSREAVIGFYDQLLDRVRELPQVESAGFVRLLPLATSIGDWSLTVEGYQPPPGTGTPGDWQVITDGAIAALGERIVRGRDITAADVTGGQHVALVNEAMARRYWAGRDALGGRFSQGGPDAPIVTVVGIVADVKHNGITGDVKPKFYRPHSQYFIAVRDMTLVVRTSGEPAALVPPIRAEVRRVDPELPIAAVRTMENVVASWMATPRLTGWLLATFAGLALLLAATGIYSVLSYVVSQRRREIGIRVAMGATTGRVAGLIWRSGLTATAAGAAAGMAIAALTTRAMVSLLHGVTPLDPVSFVAAPALLMIVASIASLIPAVRAARVDAVKALRAD